MNSNTGPWNSSDQYIIIKCTYRGPRSPWRLPCRLLPTSLGLPQQGQSWKENCQCLLSSFLGHLGSRSLTWGGCRRSPCWPWSSPLRQYFNQHHKWWENLQIGIFKNAWIYKLFLIPGWGCWLTSGGGGISQQPTFQSAIKFSFRDSSWDIYDVHFIIMGQILLYTLVPFSGTLWTISLVFAGYLFKDRLWIGLESL